MTTMYQLTKTRRHALDFLANQIECGKLCNLIKLSELGEQDYLNLIVTMKMSCADIAHDIYSSLYDCKNQYIAAYWNRNERREQEFMRNPYNSVVFSLTYKNIFSEQAIAIWESIRKRYLSDTEKAEIAMALTPRMEACADDLNSRCN